MSPEAVARVCHETNRAWQEVTGEAPSLPWEQAPAWQRESSLDGVRHALAGVGPEELHEAWCRHRLADGWRWGPTKDPELKTHPCLVPYGELPAVQRVKDDLFLTVVRVLGPLVSGGRRGAGPDVGGA
ncbi:hypothetical protein FOE67_20425 [Streptomyces calidiresistens]|uniref:Ryanodine receptor Ryr domain-containing protein n=1 Tax=Streptomyces calidiresistens TaxID=1485586 RepID=A0A7W3T6E9_9ACTN|nr:hypothetical protein [Streptomyces calidiresistens]